MTGYRNKYLEMLKAEKSKKPLGKEPSKPSKLSRDEQMTPGYVPSKPSKLYGGEQRAIFEGFEGSQVGGFSEFSPPLDAEGVPCGLCPSCHRGEFWRWPRFHKDHNPTGWVCWFCSPSARGVALATSAACPSQML